MRANARARGALPTPKRERPPTERAFVIQFEPTGGARCFRGRAEVVGSGEATRFRSRKHLLDFMAEILRR
jgi:hypothetical protein